MEWYRYCSKCGVEYAGWGSEEDVEYVLLAAGWTVWRYRKWCDKCEPEVNKKSVTH